MDKNDILNFVKPQHFSKVMHNDKVLFQFESKEPMEYKFVLDNRAELKTFKNNENE